MQNAIRFYNACTAMYVVTELQLPESLILQLTDVLFILNVGGTMHFIYYITRVKNQNCLSTY